MALMVAGSSPVILLILFGMKMEVGTLISFICIKHADVTQLVE